jgi:hypothetical protein
MADNVALAWKFLRGKGLTPAQAAGVIGSMQGESGVHLDPAAENPGPDHALGIAQWLGARKNAAVQSRKLVPPLEHLWSELQGPESKAFKSIKAARTVQEAAVAWQRDFERGAPFEQKYNLRVANARKVLQRMGGVPGSASIASPDINSGSSGTPGTPGSSRTTTTTTPGIDNSAQRAALIQQFLGNKNSDVLDFALQARTLQDVPGTTSTKTIRTPGTPSPDAASRNTGPTGGRFGASHSPLLELIHKGDRAYAVKDGRRVNGPQFYASVWNGHADHVHVAAGQKTIVDIGRMAQAMGLHVGENPHFGGVDPVHVPNSYHYKGEAIDVSGDPGKMNAFARRVESLYGIKQ